MELGVLSTGHRGAERGRPRDPTLDRAILETVRELLTSKGYQRLSVQEVTRICGVHVRTITRRWGTKPALVTAAVLKDDAPSFPATLAPAVATGNLRTDVRELIERNLAFLSDPAVSAALPALWAEMVNDVEVAQRFADREQEWAAAISAVVTHAVAAGKAPARVATRVWLLPHILGGATFYARSMSSMPVDGAFVDGLADFVMAALLAE